MVKFTKDDMVQPIESEWFQFYKPGQDREIQPFAESNAAVSTSGIILLFCFNYKLLTTFI